MTDGMTHSRRALLWAATLTVPVAVALGVFWFVAYASFPKVSSHVVGDPLMAYDAEIGFVPRPDSTSSVGDWHIYTDRRGARVNAPGEQTPDQFEIVVIGCSFAWGVFAANEETYPQQLGKALGVRVANFSMAGYSGLQALQLLRRNKEGLRPKLIIYGYITDHMPRNVNLCGPHSLPLCLDASHVARDRGGVSLIAPPEGNGVERAQLYLRAQTEWLDPLTWLRHGLDRLREPFRRSANERTRADGMLQAKALDYVLGEMKRTADDLGAKLLVVYLPYPNAYVHHEVFELAKLRYGFDTLDLFPAYFAHPDCDQFHFPNDAHPNAAGNRFLAEEIAKYIRARDVLLR